MPTRFSLTRLSSQTGAESREGSRLTGDSSDGFVHYEVADRVATLTIDRPERLNAISPRLDDELLALLDRAAADASVHAAVIAGAGRAFSTGADSKRDEASGMPVPTSVVEDREGRELNLQRCFRIWDLRLPVIAKVHGYCLGRAVQLAAVCDVTFVAEDARVGAPQLPFGAGFNSVYWAWLIGPKKAKELFFATGSIIGGSEAVRIGLFNRAVPADQLDGVVAEYAAKLARVPRELLALEKRAINRTQDLRGFRQAMLQAVEVNVTAHHSEAVYEMNRRITEHGLKATIEAFRRGEIGV